MSRKSTNTKTRILNAAINLFSTHGFGATSIDDILSAVGITKGAFYYHFKSKEHLCQLILDEATQAIHQLSETVQASDAPQDLLQTWMTELIEKQSSGQWLYFRLLSRLSVESPQLSGAMQNQLKTYWLWYQSFFETLIRRARSEGQSNSGPEPAALARAFIAAHFGALWLDRCAPNQQDMITVCETLLKTMLK